MKKNARREQMLSEAALIFSSVSFFEDEVNKKLGELDEAVNNNYIEDLPQLEKQVIALIKKLTDENKEIDNFIIKYKKELSNEKKAILPRSKQKE
jgi:PIN domain nuclease of toxin-antitoxin system